MKLSLQLILETLTEYGAQLIETDGDFAFTGRTDPDLSHGYSGAGHAVCLHTESAPKAEKAAF